MVRPAPPVTTALALLASLAVGWCSLSAQGGRPAAVPLEKRGPAVGSVAPAIRLRDQHDREQTLATLAGKDGLVLLFVRSADW
jgi:hypothetical protein